MKTYLQLIIPLIILLVFSCKKNATEQKKGTIEKEVEIKKPKNIPNASVTPKKKVETPKHYEHLFVIAKSGLNYRDMPKGTILGKFPLNSQLKIIEYTKIQDRVKDDEKTIKGEWVGVENGKDTVYVFNGFLSPTHIQSDIKLYYASSYYKEKDGETRTAFLNLSETYFENTYSENSERNTKLILTESDLAKDTIRLNQNQRKKLLNEINLSESDKVFVYSVKNDSITSYVIKDLSAIACMNIYGSNDYKNQEHDYEFGFDLGKSITDWDNLVFVGKENPFQTGKLKPIVWKQIENKLFPGYNDLKNPKISLITFLFSTEEHSYFLQKSQEGTGSHHLAITINNSKVMVFNKHYHNSEGAYLTELNIVDEENNEFHQSQWAGKLFKNKPAIVFGMLSYSFGCPFVAVLDETEPSIPILCDNRH